MRYKKTAYFTWGVNGSDSIANFVYAVYMNSSNNYIFGSGGNGSESITLGSKPSGLANPNARWEESRQTDIGIDAGFFSNRLTLTVDYYRKQTAGMLLSMPVPSYSGDSAPIGNLGDMVNSGVEIDLGWKDRIGDFNYHISGNVTYGQSKLTYLGDDSTHLYGSNHKIGQLTRGSIGLPFPYFYGYQSDGIFQNAAEVAAHVNKDGELLQPKAAPGDVRFKDIDGNGILNDDDRTMIGKGIPDWTFGVNLGFNWKGIDFNVLLQGQAGCQIFNVSRRTDLYYVNLNKSNLNRWTGEGSTNRYPRFCHGKHANMSEVSDIWIENGDYFKVSNITFGYDFKKLFKNMPLTRCRLYVSAQNMLTFTKYTGMDPEIGYGDGTGWMSGVDVGNYPSSNAWIFGVNLTF